MEGTQGILSGVRPEIHMYFFFCLHFREGVDIMFISVVCKLCYYSRCKCVRVQKDCETHVKIKIELSVKVGNFV